ncbi:hypothetical protein LM3 [Methanocella arvoryzae MRE50]|uniref:Uncharacterized protein n=1 Tax=Methanocella arvoryzae (strain DSM 22066 / NBRC 105507 / MRE50) TaxID=351160 RepID=Q0W8L8_METAR|nr:hypothetical protein orf12 [uncultured archaeon]CAJ35275.1 hypothetical protein LM3 [Methanocella arvoryzae MRE50]
MPEQPSCRRSHGRQYIRLLSGNQAPGSQKVPSFCFLTFCHSRILLLMRTNIMKWKYRDFLAIKKQIKQKFVLLVL